MTLHDLPTPQRVAFIPWLRSMRTPPFVDILSSLGFQGRVKWRVSRNHAAGGRNTNRRYSRWQLDCLQLHMVLRWSCDQHAAVPPIIGIPDAGLFFSAAQYMAVAPRSFSTSQLLPRSCSTWTLHRFAGLLDDLRLSNFASYALFVL